MFPLSYTFLSEAPWFSGDKTELDGVPEWILNDAVELALQVRHFWGLRVENPLENLVGEVMGWKILGKSILSENRVGKVMDWKILGQFLGLNIPCGLDNLLEKYGKVMNKNTGKSNGLERHVMLLPTFR